MRSASTESARRLWTRIAAGARDPAEIAAAAVRVQDQLGAGLGRWIGPDGYRVIQRRAFAAVQQEYPALSGIPGLDGNEAPAEPAGKPSAAEMTAGMVAWVAELIEVLGRIIGEEMAVHLVDQTGRPSPRGVVSTKTVEGLDG
jgi:hypothetical protein